VAELAAVPAAAPFQLLLDEADIERFRSGKALEVEACARRLSR
jgi:hypothetical protein